MTTSFKSDRPSQLGKQNDGGSKMSHPHPGRSSNASNKASKIEVVVSLEEANPFTIAVTPTHSSSKATVVDLR